MATHLARLALALAWLLGLGALAYFAWQGLPYYLTPLIERPRHPLYWTFKPGGSLGLAFGITGASLMVVMQLYTLRKRARWLRRAGALRWWLRFHIFCGVTGPLFILLHSSFKVQGLVALSFWSMVAVALSGVLGRYLYQLLPRRRSGAELTLDEVRRLSDELTARLQEGFGVEEAEIEHLDRLATAGLEPDAALLPLLFRLPFDGVRLRWRVGRWRQGLHAKVPRGTTRRLARLALRRAQLRRRSLVLSRLQELFYYWHVLHKPFAVVMYLFMFVHIGVATATGYAWTFR